MNIIDKLDIKLDKRELITFVGAGGKTTTMFNLAEELRLCGKTILVTTTTAIFYPQSNQFDDIIIGEAYSKELFLKTKSSGVIVYGREVNEAGKLLGVLKEDIDELFRESLFDFILVEGDGSRGKPIKAPAAYEPVVPTMTTKVVGIIGMDALGKKINSGYVHRPEIFCTITNSSEDDIIDVENITKLVLNENGLYRNAPTGCKKYLLFNKVDKEKDIGSIEAITRELNSAFESKIIRECVGLEKICTLYLKGGLSNV